jgi:hypothetical protein
MNWTMPPRIGSKIGTATAAAALISLSALFAPTQAFATPTSLTGPGYATDATHTAASGRPHDGDDDYYYDDTWSYDNTWSY